MQEKIQKISPIKQRILEYADILNISKRDFYKKIGVSRGTLESKTGITEDVMAKFIATFPAINPDWLLTGNGPMLRGEVTPIAPDNVFSLRTDRIVERQHIPIYDMEAVAGLISLFSSSYTQKVMEFMETALIPKCDGGLRIVGDSMYPLLKSGDVVFYKEIHDIPNNLLWGEMYLISFDMDGEEFVTVKYLQKSNQPDHVTLVSYNEHHKPLDIHRSRIRAMAFIKASLRVNSIK